MRAEPRRWTADEVRAACQRGERDFRGGDLSGLNLRGADLRGADFREANLRGACLAGCRLGPTIRWWVAQQTIAVLVGTGAGNLNLFMSLLIKVAIDNDAPVAIRLLNVLAIVGVFATLARRGIIRANGHFNFVGSCATAVAVAFLGASSDSAGANSGFIFVASGLASALASLVAAMGAIIVAFAGTGAVAAALAVTIADIVHSIGIDDGTRNVSTTIMIGGGAIALLVFSFYFRNDALNGAPRSAWLRTLVLWLTGLGGARFAGADLTDADLSQVQARGADLRRARLVHTSFRDARDLHLARFDGPLHSVPLQRLALGLPARSIDLAGQDLASLALDGADLRDANLRGASLKEARLRRGQLDGASLEHVDLCGTDLRGASVRRVELRGARVDVQTFLRSGWTADDLAEFCDRGGEVIGLEGFPTHVQVRLLGEKEGLTLFFSTRLSTFDKVLVDGVIVGVLGRDTKCHSEYRVHGEAAIVRLFDAPREDLERVAEALHLKVWEQAQAEQQKAIVRAPEVLPQAALREGLSDLMGRRLERIELREAPPEPGPAVLRWRWENPAEPGADQLLGPKPCRLLVLYASADRNLATKMVSHLMPLVRQRLIDPFDGADLSEDDVADDVLSAHLESADAVVALVSPHLFREGPWYQRLERALARQATGARVIPVLVRAVSWEGSELAQLQPLPEGGVPVTEWHNRDQAWTCVVSGLRRVLLNQCGAELASKERLLAMAATSGVLRSVSSRVRSELSNVHPYDDTRPTTMASGKILFLAADTVRTDRLDLDKEVRDIEQKLRAAEHRDFFSLKTRWAVTADDLLQALLEDKPSIVHFSGHGSAEPAGIVLHGENSDHHLVKADALKRLFKAVGGKVRVVVLNACYSEPQARAIAEVVDCVVGMKTAVSDEAARKFAASFYRGLGFGGSVQDAFDQGLVAIDLHSLDEQDVPQLLVKEGVDAQKVILASGVGGTVPEPEASKSSALKYGEELLKHLSELVVCAEGIGGRLRLGPFQSEEEAAKEFGALGKIAAATRRVAGESALYVTPELRAAVEETLHLVTGTIDLSAWDVTVAHLRKQREVFADKFRETYLKAQ